MMKDIFKENGALVLAEGVGSANDDWLLCRRPLRRDQKEKNKHRQNDPKKVGRGKRPKKEQRNSDSHSEYVDFVSKGGRNLSP